MKSIKELACLLVTLAIILSVTLPCNADTKGNITLLKIFDAETIVASDSATSDAIRAYWYKMKGYASVYLELTGSGTAKIEVLISQDRGITYLEPSALSDVATGHTVASGPGSDGKDTYIIDFEGIVPHQFKVKITETGGANSVTVTAWLCFQ